MTFGQRLKKARTEKHMTQKKLAEILSVKHNSISNWENDINKPDPATIELLCGVLDITPNYLLAVSQGDFSPAEKLLIKKYRELDAHGRDMVDIVLDKECERMKQNNVTVLDNKFEYSAPFAAHERTDIEVTDEMRQHDADIMNADDF